MVGEVRIRETTSDDRAAVLDVVRAAFSKDGRDGQDEVDVTVETWSRDAAPPALDLVAVDDAGAVIGHVVASRGELGDARDVVLGVAPLSVAPAHQRRGVGSALMDTLIARADAAGEPMLLLLGSTDYYPRFGFEPAASCAIHYAAIGESAHFQIRKLSAYDRSLTGGYVYSWELPLTLP